MALPAEQPSEAPASYVELPPKPVDIWKEAYRTERSRRRAAFHRIRAEINRLSIDAALAEGDEAFYRTWCSDGAVTRSVAIGTVAIEKLGPVHQVIVNDESRDVQTQGLRLKVSDFMLHKTAGLFNFSEDTLTRTYDERSWSLDATVPPVLFFSTSGGVYQAASGESYMPPVPSQGPKNLSEVLRIGDGANHLAGVLQQLGDTSLVHVSRQPQ